MKHLMVELTKMLERHITEAELARTSGGRIWDGDHLHSRRPGRHTTTHRVFEGEAVQRIDTKLSGGDEIGVGVGLSVRIVLSRVHDLETLTQTEGGKGGRYEPRVRRRAKGQAETRCLALVESIEDTR